MRARSLAAYALSTAAFLALLGSARAENKPPAVVVFDFESKGKRLEDVKATRVTEEEDRARMDRTLQGGSTARRDTLDNEKNLYWLTGYAAAPDALEVNGFPTGVNQPTSRVNCAGLTFARLIGGPLVLSTAQGWRIVEAFGTKIEEREAVVGDVLFWRDPGSRFVQHFALVSGWKSIPSRAGILRELTIVSKDDKERVYIGPAKSFPAEHKNCGVARSYYRLDWDAIKATQRPAPGAKAGQRFYAQYYDKAERTISGAHRYKSPAEAQEHLDLLKQIADGVTLAAQKDGTYIIRGKTWRMIESGGSSNADDAKLAHYAESWRKSGHQVQITDMPNWGMFTIDMSNGIRPELIRRHLPKK